MQNSIDDKKLGFGKYAFKTANEIAGTDPSYIVWVYENVTNGKDIITKSLYTACQMDLEDNNHTEDCYSIW